MRALITGATGSLGQTLVKHLLATTDWRVIVFSRDELKQAVMRAVYPDPRVDFFLGDVRDLSRLEMAFDAGVDLVIHAAALKRVDSAHSDPDEFMKTNISGSRNVLHAARGRVGRVLLISSDKAAYPTNVYGATKMAAEHLFTGFNVYGAPAGTVSAVVRYGNVMASRGSVLQTWRDQLAQGKPLQLTDPSMTRFLLTLPQAAALVVAVATTMEGGEIIVPRLPAARLDDLATAFAPGHPTEIVGLRPGGEKHHETLLTGEEMARAIPHGDNFIVPPTLAPWRTVSRYDQLTRVATPVGPLTSDRGRRLSIAEIQLMLAELGGT